MLNTVLIATMFLPSGGAVPAQPVTPIASCQDDEKPDKRPEVKDLLAQLKQHAGKRGKEDQQAIAVIDTLLIEFEASGLKDRASIAKGVGACLKQKRTTNDEGVRDNKLYLAAAVSLGEMGPESVKPLQSWIGHKQHRKDLELQRRLILSLGKTRDPKAIDTLSGLLQHSKPIVQAAAAEALGNYDGVGQKQRKEIFNDVLKILGAIKNQVDANVNDTIARERYDVVAAPMITTLQGLSGYDERDPAKWQRWWNKNKKKDWDKED